MAQCKITFECIKQAGEWTNEEAKNWIHPAHGPLPEDLLRVDTDTDHYVIAVWIRDIDIVTALECPEKPTGRGAILWSARWRRRQSDGRVLHIKTGNVVAQSFDYYRDAKEFYQEFIPAVIEDAETSPLGSATQGRREVIKNGAWVGEPT